MQASCSSGTVFHRVGFYGIFAEENVFRCAHNKNVIGYNWEVVYNLGLSVLVSVLIYVAQHI